MKKLVALSYGDFPQGGASSIRLCSLAKLFMEKGYEVYVLSMSKSEQGKWKNYQGIKYVSLRSPKRDKLSRLFNVLQYTSRAKKEIAVIGEVNVFLIMGVFPAVYKMCEDYALLYKSILIADCTEWYSSSEFTLGILSPEYLRNNIINSRCINPKWKTISITTFFENYFKSKHIKTVRIPAIMDISEFAAHIETVNNKRTIVYAGSPAKKDALALIIKGFTIVDDKITGRLKLKVIGITKEEFTDINKNLLIPDSVEFIGRIPRKQVLEELRKADFTTLMRDQNERYSIAGFPSKVAESLSAGVPVITNFSSDLSLYLVNKKNAIVVKAFSSESYAEALLDVLAIPQQDIIKMSKNAFMTAKRYIDYVNYRDKIDELLE